MFTECINGDLEMLINSTSHPAICIFKKHKYNSPCSFISLVDSYLNTYIA